MEFTQLFWIAFTVLSALPLMVPAIRVKVMEGAHLEKLRKIEKKRKVIQGSFSHSQAGDQRLPRCTMRPYQTGKKKVLQKSNHKKFDVKLIVYR
jgi:hypothetical protein